MEQELDMVAVDASSLSEKFASFFSLDFVRTPEQLRQAQHLRYEVYCREFKFEREEDCPGQLEQDEFDANAIHCLAFHRPSGGQIAGGVRIVMTTREQPDLLLPLEKYCADSLYPDCDPHPSRTPRSTSCEVSRLAVHPHFRRRPGEAETRVGVIDPQFGSPSEEERRTYPMIGMALICAASSTTLRIGRPTVYIVVEDWLAVWLRRAGLPLVQIGNATEYHGRRTAFYLSAEKTVAGFKGDSRSLYDFVDRSLRDSVERQPLGI